MSDPNTTNPQASPPWWDTLFQGWGNLFGGGKPKEFRFEKNKDSAAEATQKYFAAMAAKPLTANASPEAQKDHALFDALSKAPPEVIKALIAADDAIVIKPVFKDGKPEYKQAMGPNGQPATGPNGPVYSKEAIYEIDTFKLADAADKILKERAKDHKNADVDKTLRAAIGGESAASPLKFQKGEKAIAEKPPESSILGNVLNFLPLLGLFFLDAPIALLVAAILIPIMFMTGAGEGIAGLLGLGSGTESKESKAPVAQGIPILVKGQESASLSGTSLVLGVEGAKITADVATDGKSISNVNVSTADPAASPYKNAQFQIYPRDGTANIMLTPEQEKELKAVEGKSAEEKSKVLAKILAESKDRLAAVMTMNKDGTTVTTDKLADYKQLAVPTVPTSLPAPATTDNNQLYQNYAKKLSELLAGKEVKVVTGKDSQQYLAINEGNPQLVGTMLQRLNDAREKGGLTSENFTLVPQYPSNVLIALSPIAAYDKTNPDSGALFNKLAPHLKPAAASIRNTDPRGTALTNSILLEHASIKIPITENGHTKEVEVYLNKSTPTTDKNGITNIELRSLDGNKPYVIGTSQSSGVTINSFDFSPEAINKLKTAKKPKDKEQIILEDLKKALAKRAALEIKPKDTRAFNTVHLQIPEGDLGQFGRPNPGPGIIGGENFKIIG